MTGTRGADPQAIRAAVADVERWLRDDTATEPASARASGAEAVS